MLSQLRHGPSFLQESRNRSPHSTGSPSGISDLFDRFAAARRQSLERLLGLNLQCHELESAGTHPDLGRVTLQQLLATWVVHDLTHIAQIVRVMAKQYDAAVGPWKGYMRILRA